MDIIKYKGGHKCPTGNYNHNLTNGNIYLIGKNGYGINLETGYYDNYLTLFRSTPTSKPKITKMSEIKIEAYSGITLYCNITMYTVKETNKAFVMETRFGRRLITTNYIYPITDDKTNIILCKSENGWDQNKKELPSSLTISKKVKSITIK